MTTTILQQLLVALIETGQAIAAEPDDPMHDALAAAADIDWVAAGGDETMVITTSGGRRLRVTISEAP